MKRKRWFCALAVVSTLLALAMAAPAQQKNTPAAVSAAGIKPVRTTSGVMKDNRIAVRRSDWINRGAPLFDLTLTGARVADGRLEFAGSLQGTGRQKAQPITATLVSTSARSANPWPSATAPTSQPRQRAIQNAQGQQPTANQTQPPGNPQAPPQAERTERNEQTQSLFSAGESGTGCELLFLRMQPTGQAAPVQVGVVLAHQDNERGNEINKNVCRVVRALNAKENADEALAQLNQLLSPAR